MPTCSILRCGSKKDENTPNLTLHRLPTIEAKRNTWLEIIGLENLDTSNKHIFICSLHFEESCFNRTMNIVKLRDDARPSWPLVGEDVCVPVHQNMIETVPQLNVANPVTSTPSATDASSRELQIIEKLKDKCKKQTKKIKRLNEKVRRQKKKIADLGLIIKDLKEKKMLKSEAVFVLEDCATHFLTR